MLHDVPPTAPPEGPPLDALLALPNLGINLACGLRGCLASAVRAEHPRDLRVWPGLGDWAFDGRIAPGGHVVIVIEPSLANTVRGPGRLQGLPEGLVLPLPPRSAEQHETLRRAIRIEDDATVFVFPLRAASDDLKVLWPALTLEDRASLDEQLTWNLAVHQRFLGGGESVRPSESKPRATKMRLAEANERAREILRSRPDISVRDLADEIPCSLGLAAKTSAWKAVAERRKLLAPPQSVRAVAVDPQALQAMIDDQSADMSDDERLPARRVPRQRKRWTEE